MSSNEVEELKEKLAAIEHERWADWQIWVHKQGRVDYTQTDDGDAEKVLAIPIETILRWERQADTHYDKLSDKEKDSDREQVDRYWPLVEALILQEANRQKLEMLDKLERHKQTEGHPPIAFVPLPAILKALNQPNVKGDE